MSTPAREIGEKNLAGVCRRYRTNREAAKALGIHARTLRELCAEYGIKSPYERKMGGWQ